MFKNLKKKIFKENSHKYRLKYLLKKFFGDSYLEKYRKWNYFKKKFNFFKNKLDKSNNGQKIVKSEKGLILDLTVNNYLTYHLRPKLSEDFRLESTCQINEKFSVIIQGPIKENFVFLKETLKIYKKIFKNSLIIVSTWENEKNKLIESLSDTNIHFIFNKEIEKSKFNLNQQITTTSAALNFAKLNDIKYCLKTRTDQRIYNNNLESFLISLLKTFPVKKNELSKSRIVVPTMGTFKYFIYHLTDLMMFGETDDLINYWDNETYEIGLKKMGLSKKNWFINETPLCPETFLCTRYIGKIEDKVIWDLKNWWRCLKDYFCVVDNSSIDLLWFKFDWEIEYRYLKTYTNKLSRSVSFHEWLSLYNNFNNNWETFSKTHEKFEEFDDPYISNNYRSKNHFFD